MSGHKKIDLELESDHRAEQSIDENLPMHSHVIVIVMISDVWQGTSGTSRDLLAVGLESLSGLKM